MAKKGGKGGKKGNKPTNLIDKIEEKLNTVTNLIITDSDIESTLTQTTNVPLPNTDGDKPEEPGTQLADEQGIIDTLDLNEDENTENGNVETHPLEMNTEGIELSDIKNDLSSLKSTEALLETNEDELNGRNQNKQELSEYELNPDLDKFLAACQQGDLDVVKDLISSRKVEANDVFSDNVTGLHWAAINNRLLLVKYLMENEYSQADPNYLGGDLKASPLHWACRNGLVYIVEYLLENTSADPTLRDCQSYNALHLSVHSSNVTLVLYMLFACCDKSSKKKIHVDETDSSNRTSLHWAAYQGDVFTINALLKFGADVSKADNSLFTPLHWGFIKGYKSVLLSLLEAGSDIYYKNDQGKNTFDIAKDMKCYNVWIKVLKESGRDENNNWELYKRRIDPKFGKVVTFMLPYFILPIVFQFCTFSRGYIIPKLVASISFFAAMIYLINKFIIPIYLLEDNGLAKSPFLAGVFSGTAFWAALIYAFKILPRMIFTHFVTTTFLGFVIIVFFWSFYKAMFINPGYVPVPTDNQVVFAQIKDLIRLGKFDTDNFCVNSYVRKPLRSKYSRLSKRLVARFDHNCPWIYNEVGVRNHKLFMVFIYSLEMSIVLFTLLSTGLFEKLEDGYDSDDEGGCILLSDDLCYGYRNHHFHFNILIWILFQGFWIALLIATQTYQIFRGLTSWEFMVLNKNVDKRHRHSTVPIDMVQPTGSPVVPSKNKSSLNSLSNLIGLDQFIAAIKLVIGNIFNRASPTASHVETISDYEIPTDYGIKQNILDFWCLGEIKLRNVFYLPIEGENNLNGKVVDYYRLYEFPSKNPEDNV